MSPGMPLPTVNPWLQLLCLFGLFLGGGLFGWTLASWAAPGSGFGIAISGLLLPMAFAAGMLAWSGLDLVRQLFRRDAETAEARARLAARSTRWFTPLATSIAALGGFVVGLVPGGQGPLFATVAYGLAGWLYGRLLARAVRWGYLPGPND